MIYQPGYHFPYIDAHWVLTKSVCFSKKPLFSAIKYSGIGVVIAVALDIIFMLGVELSNGLILLANYLGLHFSLGPKQPQPNIRFKPFA